MFCQSVREIQGPFIPLTLFSTKKKQHQQQKQHFSKCQIRPCDVMSISAFFYENDRILSLLTE